MISRSIPKDKNKVVDISNVISTNYVVGRNPTEKRHPELNRIIKVRLAPPLR